MRREEWRRDPAPLAYRVLPQPEEFFDSWLDRLVSRHGTTRAGLFEFLGLEPGLARLDLGGGQEVTGRADAAQAIERLAWAVQCEVSVVQATLVPASGECLLPPRGRHYGCPQCWLEFHLAGKPLVIQREWTLRQSWLCRKHQALLVDLRDVPRRADGVIDLASLRRLAAVAVRTLELLGFAEPRLLANRHAALKLLGQGAAERPPPGLDAYMREFSANRLHVVPARTLLLAHAHCHDRELPRRFAATFAVPGCPGTEMPRMPLPKSAMSRAMLTVALRRVHRHRLRRRYRCLEAVAQRLSAFSYLARVGCDGPDWCQRALHERWFIREICRYHMTPHEGLGKIAPAQMWADGLAAHGSLVPTGLDVEQLTRRFLPWVERTVTAGGVQIGHRRYWHESFATRIGLKIMIHVDERTIQEVYPQIDEKLVAARVVGSFPHVTKVEWDAAAAALRNRGRAFQQSGGQTEIARLVHANRQEVQGATIRTREQRCLRKRLEREGISHSAGPPPEGLQEERAKWLPVEELGEVKWLKPINQ